MLLMTPMAGVVDLERLVWTPGQTISVPQLWVPNRIHVDAELTKISVAYIRASEQFIAKRVMMRREVMFTHDYFTS